MVTAFGDDLNAQKLAASCGELGIDISQSPVRSPAAGPPPTSSSTTPRATWPWPSVIWTSTATSRPRSYFSAQRGLLDNAQVIVIDTNIPAESIAWLAENCPVPIFADPVSTAKAVKLPPGPGKAPHPQAQPHRGGAALRRVHQR